MPTTPKKNWLFRITFLTVFAVCGLDANNTKKLVIWYYTICKNNIEILEDPKVHMLAKAGTATIRPDDIK